MWERVRLHSHGTYFGFNATEFQPKCCFATEHKEVSLWKCIKRFRCSLRRRNLRRTNHLSFLNLRLSFRHRNHIIFGLSSLPKTPFSKCFSSTRKRKAGIFKFLLSESVFFIPWPPVNFHINRGDLLLKIRVGPWTWSKWWSNWTRCMGWSMDPGTCLVYVPSHEIR